MTDQQEGWCSSKPLQGTWDDNFGRSPHAQPPSWEPPASPRKKQGFWKGFGVVFGIAVVGLVIAAGASNNGGGRSSPAATTIPVPTTTGSIVPQTSVQQFYAQYVDKYANSVGITGIKSTTCAFPKAWVVGQSFDCYVYGPSNSQDLAPVLATISVTPLTPTSAEAWNANFNEVGL